MTAAASHAVRPGDAAPGFTLPAIHRDGSVSLADYRDRSPLMLAIFRGLYCPFCRRGIAQFGAAREKLRAQGVEALAVVASDLERARLYFKYRPAAVPLLADPGLVTHRAYGLPQTPIDEKVVAMAADAKINPTGELPGPTPLLEAVTILNRKDGYPDSEPDSREWAHQGALFCGQFLVDASGTVRWSQIEASEGPSGFGKFPSESDLMVATRALA